MRRIESNKPSHQDLHCLPFSFFFLFFCFFFCFIFVFVLLTPCLQHGNCPNSGDGDGKGNLFQKVRGKKVKDHREQNKFLFILACGLLIQVSIDHQVISHIQFYNTGLLK